jgi:hypothetical protein
MISVIGGTYREIEYDDISMEIFGSGFRCCKFLLENSCKVQYYTSGNKEVERYLNENKKVYQSFDFQLTETIELITFKYSFALDYPQILPNIRSISKTDDIIVGSGDVICYGMMESDFKINCNKVVYDPQTAIHPKSFATIGTATELVYIVNLSEARSISGEEEFEKIKNYFFNVEKAKALIIKNGPHGAKLFYADNEILIPSFITDRVSKIGSGDIFTSSFGYYWMEKNLPLEDCAILASKSTASYCNAKVYVDATVFDFGYKEFKTNDITNKQIYLAAPFFTIAELILIDKIRTAFLDFGVKVFSPFHDVGFGNHESVAKQDLDGLKKSDIVFAVFDNLDSGTLIESGFALAIDKKIIGYHRTCSDSDLLMLRPGIKIFDHLTSAMYQTIWNL